uniref:Uncharacterized protein n=1 Tax=viral metagenome TaxID=1070528 RepID=A0A6M3JID8_9ZZZZ
MALESVEFFGAVDRKDRKAGEKIVSEYPAFYFTTQIDELQERIESSERALKSGAINPAAIPELKASIQRDTQRLNEINKSHVKLTGKDKDEAYKLYEHLGKEIQDSMFSRSEMMKGLANPHEELKRRTTPFIPVGKYGEVFKNIGIIPEKGKVTRNQASRMYKIIGKVIEENTNTEHLRKDYKTGTFRPDIPLEQMI